MANSDKVTIVLKSIKCINTTDSPHKDELYIKYSVDGGKDKRFPDKDNYSISPDEYNPWNINLPITYSNTLVISLYDSDTGSDQFIGSQTYYADDASQDETKTISNSNNGGNYQLNTGPN